MIGYTARDMTGMMEKLERLQALPTVQRGLRALGMTKLADWFTERERISHLDSPYVHPLQTPHVLVPGLRSHMFYPRALFPWAARIEERFADIKQELTSVLAGEHGGGFQPYRTIENGAFQMARGKQSHDRSHAPGWNMMYFSYLGERVQANRARCPVTSQTLDDVPRFAHSTIASFSALNPNTHIAPHCGPTNAVVRIHLGITVPQGCRIRVGDQFSSWREGKLLFLNDAFEHQVWHHGDRTRFVLFFDVWHPDWLDEELPELEHCFGPTGLVDFSETMQQIRHSDSEFLAGQQWHS